MLNRSIASLAFAAPLGVPGIAFATASEIDTSTSEGRVVDEPVVVIDSTGRQIGSTKSDRSSVAYDDRPLSFELEALYQYSETNAQLSTSVPAVAAFAPPMRDDRVLYSDNVGGAFRVLGPMLGSIGRPFIQVRGVSNVTKDEIRGGAFGRCGVTGLAATGLQQNYGIGAGLGFAVPVEVGPTVFTLKPYANYLWEQYTIRVLADERASGFNRMSQTSKDITLGSVEAGGQLDFQPSKDVGFYLFAGAGLRIPTCDDKRRVDGQTAAGFEDVGVAKFTTSAVANGGVGWKF